MIKLLFIFIASHIVSDGAAKLSKNDDLGKCCHHVINEVELTSCIQNQSASFKGNGKKVGIVTFSTEHIEEYSVFAHSVNMIYAEHNNYEIQYLNPNNFPEYDPSDLRWSKVKILHDAVAGNISSWGSDIEYFMWVDSDVIFLDINLRIEDFFSRYPQAHMIMSAESAGSKTLVNTGTIMVRKSSWSEEFLAEWWGSAVDRVTLSDQERFDKIYKQRKDKTHSSSDASESEESYFMEDAIVVLPPDTINSEPPAKFRQLPNNPVLHLMGESNEFRTHVFRTALMTLCGHIHGALCELVPPNDNTDSETTQEMNMQCSNLEADAPLPAQLGITTDKMQSWSLDIYSKEFARLYDQFKKKAETGANTLSECAALANAAKHFSETLQVQEEMRITRGETTENATLETLDHIAKMRRVVYEIVTNNFQKHEAEAQRHKQETGQMLVYWPEMIRNVVSVTQALMITPHGVSSAEKIALAGKILDRLYELYEIVGESQQEIVYHMVAMHYKEMAAIYRDAGDLSGALESALLSVNMTQEIANIAGEHVMVTSLATLASAYAKIGQFSEGLDAIQRAGDIAQRQLGPWHDLVMEIRLNHAVMAFEAKQFDVAQVRATQAKDIILRSNREQNMNHLKTAKALLVAIKDHQ
jgi:tetratricopeptide (TPR) repeat protein